MGPWVQMAVVAVEEVEELKRVEEVEVGRGRGKGLEEEGG